MESRKRASAACRQCRASKVRCDVAGTGVPCSRCHARGEDDQCQLLPSRRGLHHQNAKRKQRWSQLASDQDSDSLRDDGTVQQTTTEHGVDYTRNEREDATADANPQPITSPPATTAIISPQPSITSTTVSQGQRSADGSAINTAIPARYRAGSHVRSQASPDSAWVSIFETLLDSKRHDSAIDNASITFLGESFPLAHLLGNKGIRMPHPRAQTPQAVTTRSDCPPHLSEEDIRYLSAKECLSIPSQGCLDILIGAFIERVYPLYPIVVLQDFLEKFKSSSLPLILLNAACCAGSSFCSLADLTPLGFESRKEARDVFYNRAKMLFDFNYEDNKIVVLQSTTLLSFWPSVPRDVWTFYHWIGFSVTLAESLGVHRSMAQVDMPDKNRSLLKRIWGTLVVRDVWGAALFGRPLRINELQCDDDPLTADDFIHDVAVSDDSTNLHSLYFVHVTSLAVILRPIVVLRARPQNAMQHSNISIDTLRSDLSDWRASIPLVLDWDASFPPPNVYSEVLSILYHNTLMLAHLPTSNSQGLFKNAQPAESQPLTDAVSFGGIVRDAAESILSIGTLLVTRDELTSVPHELFTGLFLAQVLLYSDASASDKSASKLAQSQMASFQMILHQVKDFWEPASWIMHLFKVLSERPKHADMTFPPDDYDWADDPVFAGVTFTDVQPYLGDLSMFDPAWPSHAALTSLFGE